MITLDSSGKSPRGRQQQEDGAKYKQNERIKMINYGMIGDWLSVSKKSDQKGQSDDAKLKSVLFSSLSLTVSSCFHWSHKFYTVVSL